MIFEGLKDYLTNYGREEYIFPIIARATIVPLASIALFLGAPTGIAYVSYQNYLYEKEKIYPDTNKDGITSTEEWVTAYKKANIYIDSLNPKNPKYLGISQLEKIIEVNR